MTGRIAAYLRRPLSLRLRLTVWYLLIYGNIQVVLLLAFALLRQDAIGRTNDDRLLQRAEELTAAIAEGGTPLKRDELERHARAGGDLAFVLVGDRDDGLLAASGLRSGAAPSIRLVKDATGFWGPRFETLEPDVARRLVGERQPLRMVTLPYRQGPDIGYVQLAARTSTVVGTLGAYSDLLFLGLPAGLLAACVAAWLISGRVVRPLNEMSLAAREVSPDNPGRRLAVRSAHEEVARLNEELNLALDRMEAGYRAQEQFIHNVSHELKTPISVILAETQVLKRSVPPGSGQAAFATSVEEEMRRLGDLVDSFLKMARTQSRHDALEMREVPIQDVVLDALRHAGSLARLHDVRVLPLIEGLDTSREEVVVAGDPQLLGTMVDNLLRNAIRFTPAGEVVEVRCTRRDGEVCFQVRDRGPGLPDEYLGRVFERFAQVPLTAPRTRGTGLGLALVREVAELHGGRVAVENNTDRGCTFSVALPEARHLAPGEATQPPSGRPPSGPRAATA